MPEFRGTTICAVQKGGKTAIAGDGQVTMGESVVFKNNAGQGAPHLRRQGHSRLCRLRGGRLLPLRAVRGDAEQVFGQPHAFGGRAGGDVAQRQDGAQARGDDDRRGQGPAAHHQRQRRGDRAGRRRVRHRQLAATTPSRRAARSCRRRTIPPPRSPTRRSRSPARSASLPTTTSSVEEV